MASPSMRATHESLQDSSKQVLIEPDRALAARPGRDRLPGTGRVRRPMDLDRLFRFPVKFVEEPIQQADVDAQGLVLATQPP